MSTRVPTSRTRWQGWTIVEALVASFLIAGCNYDGRTVPVTKSSFPIGYDLQCIDGVTYILYGMGHGSLSVKLDKDSKIVPCK